MPHQVFAVPNFSGRAVDLLFCNPDDPNSAGLVHYAYTIGAESDAFARRSFPWIKIQDFKGDYGKNQADTLQRIKGQRGYVPGEQVLDAPEGTTDRAAEDTILRLGALELLANLSSGRLSTTDKDPFPHQLALQQFVRKPKKHAGLRRLLIADEVGLGKTIEAGMILRDIVSARGQLDGFRVLYLTAGGLVDDAAGKLRNVLAGVIDGKQLVNVIDSFSDYGRGVTEGVAVASWHAARTYVTAAKKAKLPRGVVVAPDVLFIDECHHAASEGSLDVDELRPQNATQTYQMAHQLLTGTYWADSKPPRLAILMSATPFRSAPQFVNLLRLLTHGVTVPSGDGPFKAYAKGVSSHALRAFVQHEDTAADIVWRRQSDDIVKSWSGKRIFPNLTIVRPHLVSADDPSTPLLAPPSERFLDLLAEVKDAVADIAAAHGDSFRGLTSAHFEKSLTSSSVAGACQLFRWAVRHVQWKTENDFKADRQPGTDALRRLIRSISQRIAAFNKSPGNFHPVRFASDGFTFEPKSLAQSNTLVTDIHRYAKQLHEGDRNDEAWDATQKELEQLCDMAQRLLPLQQIEENDVGAEDAKLTWLKQLMDRHPEDRFLLFTESLQTCEVLESAFGLRCRKLTGEMTPPERRQAVADLSNPRMVARLLVATSAADEGFDMQIANKVIHWDLSSSPATLMQRNGRVARLGQMSDVTAYYLILIGTHEQRRDDALQQKFAELGITDEAMKSRILGSLTDDENQRMTVAVDRHENGIVGELLAQAARGNRDMDSELTAVRTELHWTQVLNRDDLAERLEAWKTLGLPDAASNGMSYEFDSVGWERPVFGETTTREPAEASRARFLGRNARVAPQTIVFDPEFLLFGPKDESAKLAGLPPWLKDDDLMESGLTQVRPRDKSDLLGTLLQNVARLGRADFATLPRRCFDESFPLPRDAVWLLFCTHPLRESETEPGAKSRPYLTYYAFPELAEGTMPEPLDAAGADAGTVHKFLIAAEACGLTGELTGPPGGDVAQQARTAGKCLKVWLETVTRFGAASFLDEARYFVPMPVALVRIVD